MKNTEAVRDVPEIQSDVAVIVEELLAIRRRLRGLRAEATETPSFKLWQHGDGAPLAEEERETVAFHLHGAFQEALVRIDELALGLLEAAQLPLAEADLALLRRENIVSGG
jgi:hypothetical protein